MTAICARVARSQPSTRTMRPISVSSPTPDEELTHLQHSSHAPTDEELLAKEDVRRPRDWQAGHKAGCRIGLLKQARGVATRYDELAVRYGAAVQLSLIWQSL